MATGSGWIDHAGVEEVLDQRVVAGELRERAVPKEVGAEVADVRDHVPVFDGHGGDRRAHARVLRPALCEEGDALVAVADGGLQLFRERLGQPALLQMGEHIDRGAARDLAGRRASHTVRDGDQARGSEGVVFVVGSAEPRMRPNRRL